MPEAQKLPRRDEVPPQHKWHTEDLYPDTEAWEQDFARVAEALPAAASFHPLGESAGKLLGALRWQDQVGERLERVYTYAHLRRDEDAGDSAGQTLVERAKGLYVQYLGATSFFTPEILGIDPGDLERFLADQPGLQLYRHKLDEIGRMRPHVLSAPEEAILAGTAELAMAPATVFRLLNDADLRFPSILDEANVPVELTKGRYTTFLESRDRRVRRDAFQTLYGAYGERANTIAGLLNAGVKKDVFYARTRRYDGALEAALDADRVPVSLYDSLIAAIHAGLPQLARYLRLRRKLLGLDELHMYDLYVPMVPDVEWQITYEEAARLVEAGLAALGEDYGRILTEGLSSGWVDVVESQGKAGGAYSTGAYGVHPYVLLNHQPNLNSVFTLAHEMGHALHTHHSNERQPYVYADYSIFVAEVASTLNESLLLHHLLATTQDRKKRLYLLNHSLEQFRTTVYRQVMFAEFEKLIHRQVEAGEALTPDSLKRTYRALNETYYGAQVVVDDEIALEWSRIPHFYSAFYVYKYATGFSAATALAVGILRDGAPARDRYLEFLSSGGSDHPVALLQKAGVDLTTPAPVRAALTVFEATLDEMEKMLA